MQNHLDRGLKIWGLQGCMRLVENLFAAYVAFLSVRLTPHKVTLASQLLCQMSYGSLCEAICHVHGLMPDASS